MYTLKDLDPIKNAFKAIMIIIAIAMFFMGYIIGKGVI